MKPQTSNSNVGGKSTTVQRTEQRSIALHTELEGPHSLPFEAIDTTVYNKTEEEKRELSTLRTNFKHSPDFTRLHGAVIAHRAVPTQGLGKLTTRSYFRKLKKNASTKFFDSLVINN